MSAEYLPRVLQPSMRVLVVKHHERLKGAVSKPVKGWISNMGVLVRNAQFKDQSTASVGVTFVEVDMKPEGIWDRGIITYLAI